jgi:threonine synthase
VLKGLAADGGLFLPEEVPFVTDWVCTLDGQHFARILSFKIFPVALKATRNDIH